MTCTQCGENLKENNAMVEKAAGEVPPDRRYVIKQYHQEPRKICMLCFIKTVIMFQGAFNGS